MLHTLKNERGPSARSECIYTSNRMSSAECHLCRVGYGLLTREIELIALLF